MSRDSHIAHKNTEVKVFVEEHDAHYKALVEHAPYCIHSINLNGEITSMNQAGLDMLGGVKEDEVCGLHYLSFVEEKDRKRVEHLLEKAFDGETSFFDFDVTVDGEKKYFKSNFVPVLSAEGIVEKLMGVSQDVTALKLAEKEKLKAQITAEINATLKQEIEERKRIEEALLDAVKEQKVMLQEIHHRVKNNLQLVSSLLGLQANVLDNEDFSKAIQDSKERIHSMAMIHESLYASETLSEIDFHEYIDSLSRHKLSAEGADHMGIQLNVPHVKFEITHMLPLGLLLNEWISNSIKHAFMERESGKITVDLEQRDTSFTLRYRDNGPGLPPNFGQEKKNSLGMDLIESFVQQLDGELEVSSSSHGLAYNVTFSVA